MLPDTTLLDISNNSTEEVIPINFSFLISFNENT